MPVATEDDVVGLEVQYLLDAKWKVIGPPRSDGALWVRADKPFPTGTYGRQKVFTKNQKGEDQPLLAHDGNGNYVHAEQVVYNPPSEPFTRQLAVLKQAELEMATLSPTDPDREAREAALSSDMALAAVTRAHLVAKSGGPPR
jgi:hypothetical protein